MDASGQDSSIADPRPRAEGDAALRAFLSERNVPCPRCRYDLRGVVAAACPECGLRLELEVKDPRRAWTGAGFVLLALAWLFLAATMNTTRNVRVIAQAFERAAQNPRAAMIARIRGQYAALQNRPEAMSDELRASRAAALASLQRTEMQIAAGQPQYDSWADVWMTWPMQLKIGSLWAAALWVAALAGLVWFVVLRLRPGSARGAGRLKVFTVCLFAAYAGWHLLLFWGEMGA